MIIKRANPSGFCFGVQKAVQEAETIAKEASGEVYTYGKLIHNEQEVERLKKNGIIPKDDKGALRGKRVIIRTHGVSPQEMDILGETNQIYDFTCPFVKKLQELAQSHHEKGFQVVILGKATHPEIQGVLGWTNHTARVVEHPEEVSLLPQGHYCLLAQTTEQEERFHKAAEEIKKIDSEALILNTICKATQERQRAIAELAAQVDVVIVIGGHESSNTKKLFQVAREYNPRTYLVEGPMDLDRTWLENAETAGVSAGASTPDWIIEEVIKEMEEMKEAMGMAEAAEAKKSPRKGAVVLGKIVQVDAEKAFVDIGGKTEGILERNEVSFRTIEDLTQVLSVGDEYYVKVIDIENENGEMKVSKKRAEEKQAIDRLLAAKESGEVITAEIYEAVKGGILADVGVRGFIPASLVDISYVEDLTQFVGKKMDLLVEEVDVENRKYILSRKAILEKEQEKVWEQLQEGSTRKGIVKKLVDFGAFIDLGGIEGLLHISEMGWGKVEKSSDLLHEGQEIEVYLLSVNKNDNKIALSLKKMKPDPWSIVDQHYKVGDVVPGKVVRESDFGAFVELEPGLDGLVHISQIAWERVEKVQDALAIGDQIQVKIMEIDPANKKMNLSIKETLARPERPERPKKEEKAPKASGEKKEMTKKARGEKPAQSAAETETIMDDKGPTGINIGELFGDKLKDLMK